MFLCNLVTFLIFEELRCFAYETQKNSCCTCFSEQYGAPEKIYKNTVLGLGDWARLVRIPKLHLNMPKSIKELEKKSHPNTRNVVLEMRHVSASILWNSFALNACVSHSLNEVQVHLTKIQAKE